MKHTTYMPSEDEENQVRIKQGNYYMNTTSKRLEQRMHNNTMRVAEQQIDSEINEFFKTHQELYGIPRIHIIHNSHQLANGYDNNVAKYKKANGLTIICLEFKLNDGSIKKLFHYSVCDLEDFYSRLEGRLCAKSRLLRSMNNSLILNVTGSFKAYSDLNLGLYSYPKHEKDPVKDDSNVSARHLLNWVIKHRINREYISSNKNSKLQNESFYKLVNETQTLNEVKELLALEHNLDPNTIQVSCDYIRPYYNPTVSKLFNFGTSLYTTADYFNSLEIQGKKLLSGGYTMYLIKGQIKDSSETVVCVSSSLCSDKDCFDKKIGRVLCLLRFKNKKTYTAFKVPNNKKINLKLAIPRLVESLYQIPVNLDLSLPQDNVE